MLPNNVYCVLLSPGAFLSSPEGMPSPAITSEDWCFTATLTGPPQYNSDIPDTPSDLHASTITPMVDALHATTASIEATVQYLSGFYNRFFASSTGLQAHQWLSQQYQTMAKASGNVTIRSFEHKWMMPSLIVRIEGNPTGVHHGEVIILGAHLDSINRQNWTQNLQAGRAPGANDDGTGIAVCMEIFKLLLQHNIPNGLNGRAIEIHAYSGEEEGLYGSADIAAEYQRESVKVAGMLMLDQCGYVRDPQHPVIGVFTDNTDVGLTALLTGLIGKYSSTPAVTSNEDHRADSDFHSFHNNGYRVGYIAEGPVDDIVYGNSKHTAFDLPETVNASHAVEIGGVALSFLLELAMGP
eukprot:TRINITY_DN27230_c0_g1_i2.p1 TRINITY_DN27230_c0_g1~~TRINITY_DN27230_c0_g1_i2.p1  ORF type:complete len:354 (+),score=85.89 TRINITY_DN27230_c0_g1_i2:114-1175(+)